MIKAILYLDENWDKVMTNIKTYSEVAFSAIKTAYKTDLGWILPGGRLIKGLDNLEVNWKEVWDEILRYSQITWELLKLGINGLTIDISNFFNEMVPVLNFFVEHLNKLIDLLTKLRIPGFKIAEWEDGNKTIRVDSPEMQPFKGMGDFKPFSPMKTVDLPFPDRGYLPEWSTGGGQGQATSMGGGITVNVNMPAGGTVILDDETYAQKFGDFIAKEIRQVLRTQGAFK